MMKYYRMAWDPETPAGTARTAAGVDWLEAQGLQTTQLFLDEEPVDYQMNVLVWKICSPRLRAILDRLRAPVDQLEWIPVPLSLPDGRTLQFFRLEMPAHSELLHPSTIMAGAKHIVKPVLDIDRIKPHKVFSVGQLDVVTHQEVRDAIVEARCTGMAFLNMLTAMRD